WKDVGAALAGSHGTPQLIGTGTLQAGSQIDVRIVNGKPLGSAALAIGPFAIGAPFKGGTFVPFPAVIVFGLPLDGAGGFSGGGAFYGGLPPGTALWFQAWMADATGPVGFIATNGLQALTP